MSLRDAKMPSLKDKIETQASELDSFREKVELEDEKKAKVIKKKSSKN